MSPFGSDYRWSTTMSTILTYMARRILGVVAKLLDRRAARGENLRAHPEGTRADR